MTAKIIAYVLSTLGLSSFGVSMSWTMAGAFRWDQLIPKRLRERGDAPELLMCVVCTIAFILTLIGILSLQDLAKN